MFTRIKKGNWNYMFLAAAASIAVAAMTALLSSRSVGQIRNRASQSSGVVITGQHNAHNSVQFVN